MAVKIRGDGKSLIFFFLSLTALFFFGTLIYQIYHEDFHLSSDKELILDLKKYDDNNITSIKERLWHRIHRQPFNLVSLVIFGCAIIHSFLTHYFTILSKRVRDKNIRLRRNPIDSFSVEILRFLGEVEVVFGIWVIPLFLTMAYVYSWGRAIHFINGIDYLEVMFVVVIMIITASSPILSLAEKWLKFVAKIGKGSVKAWWWTILILGPLSGSFITEPGAMTISAFLLGKQFYELKPPPKMAYATLGLLFTNVSVGGMFTNFAAPPVLMISKSWGWGTEYMVRNFGWKAVIGIILANLVYYLFFRLEFEKLEEKKQNRHKGIEKIDKNKKIPTWISMVHLAFLAWMVVNSQYVAIFVGSLLLFLGFYQATLPYQKRLELKPAILVGFFLAGLVIHGTLQAWWISPLLENVSTTSLLLLSTFLTSFTDNTEITFLASLIPSLSEEAKYAIVTGAMTGGGLTVIANAPNPVGETILGKYFHQGISAVGLLFGAIIPAIIMKLTFWFLRSI